MDAGMLGDTSLQDEGASSWLFVVVINGLYAKLSFFPFLPTCIRNMGHLYTPLIYLEPPPPPPPRAGLSVEEKIQLAIAQGDFDNLRGKGKPLERFRDSEGRSLALVSVYMD